MLEICLKLRRAINNPIDIAATLSTLAVVRLHIGDAVRAREGEEEALAIFRQQGCRNEEAIVLLQIGEICLHNGQDEEARGYFEQSLAIAREVKYQETESDCERMLGQLALERVDLPAACERFERALAICREAGDKRGAATALWWLGKADMERGDTASARLRLAEALQAFQSFEMNAEVLGCLEDHARLAHSLEFAEEAARLYAVAAANRERLVLPRAPRDNQRWQAALAALRAALGGAAFEAAWAEGRSWELKAAIHRALAPASAHLVAT
jgi:tetratricopeptide (TPR) repeat protein